MAPRQVGLWTVGERLGRGGNAEVYRATDGSAQEVALKVIHRHKAVGEPYERFVREIGFLRSLGRTDGVLPMLGAHVPAVVSGRRDLPWLAMPIATPIRIALEEEPIATVVQAMAQIAATLARLYSDYAVAHRDIKPGNLYRHDGAWVVGDFGLVAMPDLRGLTMEGHALGPAHFMPYEMLRDASSADPAKADVYSVAKTLWVLATCQTYPPQGHQQIGLRGQSNSDYRYHPMNGALDLIIDRATRTEPTTSESISWSPSCSSRRRLTSSSTSPSPSGTATGMACPGPTRWLGPRSRRSMPTPHVLGLDQAHSDGTGGDSAGGCRGAVGEGEGEGVAAPDTGAIGSVC